MFRSICRDLLFFQLHLERSEFANWLGTSWYRYSYFAETGLQLALRLLRLVAHSHLLSVFLLKADTREGADRCNTGKENNQRGDFSARHVPRAKQTVAVPPVEPD